MITVNKFQISADRKQIDVDVSAAATFTITGAKAWTEATYGVAASAVNITAKLTGTGPNYTFSLLPADLSVSSFDGIYFVEFTTNEPVTIAVPIQTVVAVACSFTQFFYCINDMLCNINLDCQDCNYSLNNVLMADLFLEGLKNALMIGRFTDAVNNLASLRKLCKINCDTCCGPNTTSYGFGVLNGNFILT